MVIFPQELFNVHLLRFSPCLVPLPRIIAIRYVLKAPKRVFTANDLKAHPLKCKEREGLPKNLKVVKRIAVETSTTKRNNRDRMSASTAKKSPY